MEEEVGDLQSSVRKDCVLTHVCECKGKQFLSSSQNEIKLIIQCLLVLERHLEGETDLFIIWIYLLHFDLMMIIKRTTIRKTEN